MNQSLKRGAWIVIPAIFVVMVLAVISIWSPQTSVEADAPPPILPDFDGFAFSTQLENVKVLNQTPISVPHEATGWSLVVSETFTTSLDAGMWSAIDNDGDVNGEYYWATGIYSNTTVTDTIARAISGGANGISVTVAQGYTDSVDSWLILGPVATTNANAAVVTFDYWFDAAPGDYFGVAVSTDGGLTYDGERLNGGVAGWNSVSYSLNDVVGETAVYIAFIFTSDDSGNSQNRLGAYLDNVNLYMRYTLNTYLPVIRQDFTPTPTNTATPTNTPTPTSTPEATNTPTPTATADGGSYLDNFDDANSGWEMRRTDIHDSEDYEINYTEAEELELVVVGERNYVIASPLIQAPEPPYNIETRARFTGDSEDRHIYGIIFAGNWNGNQCPDLDDFSTCFKQYYFLRVQWNEADPGDPFLEYMLWKVYTHNVNNNPIGSELIGWTSLGNASTTGWHEWDIQVYPDGKINILFNDKVVGSATDSSIIFQKYFGVMLQTKDIGGARVKFDYFKVDPIE
ncbi:MAG: hypothetical protein H6658_14530 [Ardenticatenaceae bacterium]|nr:hypothetical protein [Ardenticatenaceae bacterium]